MNHKIQIQIQVYYNYWSIDFSDLSQQNTIYNLIHCSRVACTRWKLILVQTTIV